MNNISKSILIGMGMGLLTFFLLKGSKSGRSELFRVHFKLQMGKSDDPVISQEELTAKSLAFVKKRIDDQGYRSLVKSEGENLLHIVVEQVHDTAALRQSLIKSSRLEFREMYTLLEMPHLFERIKSLEKKRDSVSKVETAGKKTGEKLLSADQPLIPSIFKFAADFTGSYFPAEIATIKLSDTASASKILSDPEVKTVIPPDLVFYYSAAQKDHKGKMIDELLLYGIRTRNKKPELANDRIVGAEADYDMNGKSQITFQLDKTGARVWENMTRNNVNNYIAIIINDHVVSAPRVLEPISGGTSSVSGVFTAEETTNLAMQLRTGVSPTELSIVSEKFVPVKGSIGLSSLVLGAIAFAIGATISFLIFKALKNK
jgi:SecD/SecF fusion protein